jgi:DNA-binding response OmpR family regulator
VLICDGDREVAKSLRLIASQGGFEADLASGAAEARRLLAEKEYAVATLALLLPDADGVGFIRELRASERTRNLPIVVISAKALQGREAMAGDSYLVMDWLDQPVSPPRLIAALRRAVEQSSGGRPRLLHVEGDRDVLQVVSVLLKGVADVTYALTLEAAKALLLQGRFDLVILDVDLPDGSGFQLLPLIRSDSARRVPVVVFSATEQSDGAFLDVEALLVKSKTTNRELLDTVQFLLKQGQA